MSAPAGEGLQRIRQRGTLIWGADQEGGGPFVFPDEADPTQVQGFEVELAELIARQLGVQARFQQGQWDKLPDLVDRGDIDIVLNGYEWTPTRADRYGVSIPYYIYELQLLGRVSDVTLTSWDDLTGPNAPRRRVCCLGGSAAHDYLMQHGQDRIEIVQFDGATDAMRATELQIDGIDANLQDLPVWTFFEDGFPALHPVGAPVGRGYYVALVRQGEPELLEAVNAAILQVMKDGSLRRILTKYRIWNAT
ncbi:MAG: amino acid ABC transporter substrate-binding protein, partial [Planctomycetaceae bacterium]|nr:amino acid ABC transporter substrate-binding protein [Planctomycetaceae bacterium]